MKNVRGQAVLILVIITFFVIGIYISQVNTIRQTSMVTRVEARDDLLAGEILETIAETMRSARQIAQSGSCPGTPTLLGPAGATYCIPTDPFTRCMPDPLNKTHEICIGPTGGTTNQIDFVIHDPQQENFNKENFFEFDLDLIPKAYAQADTSLPTLSSPPSYSYNPNIDAGMALLKKNCATNLYCLTVRVSFMKDFGDPTARVYYQTFGMDR